MGAAPGAGWEEGEFEFKLVFEEDPPPQQQTQGPNPVRTAETTSSMPAEENEGALLQLEPPKSSGGILGQSHLPDGCTKSSDSAASNAWELACLLACA